MRQRGGKIPSSYFAKYRPCLEDEECGYKYSKTSVAIGRTMARAGHQTRLFPNFLIVHQQIHYVVKERARDRNIAGLVKPLVKTFVY